MSEGKNKMGRPTVYKKDNAVLAQRLALLGLTNEEMASVFDVALSTFNKWRIDHEDFSVAIKEGKEFSDSKVAQKLFDKAMGGIETIETKHSDLTGETTTTKKQSLPDTTAQIFWLKNRRAKNFDGNGDVDAKPKTIEVTIVRGKDDD